MITYEDLFIDGAWARPAGTTTIDVIHAATEEVMGRIPEAAISDVHRAATAARRAFATTSTASVGERKAWLERLGQRLRERSGELARTIAGEVGMPLPLAQKVQVDLPIAVLASYAELCERFAFEETVGNALVTHEPVGVVACITPWNYPLHQTIAKLAAALAAGCSVVVKPSEVAPLNAFMLAEAVREAELPPGAFNLVSGHGVPVGEALVAHPEIDMVSFTGSTRAGRRVAELAADGIKRVALELGGKSPNVILDDADFELAVKRGVGNCYLNSGQTCSALTRMLVPRARHDEAVALAKAAAEAFTLGDPLEGKAKLGPLVSAAQRDRVRAYIEKGIAEGATLVTGGAAQPKHLPQGYFVEPTVFADVRSSMTIAQEEIFGPVLCILPYDDEEDAIRIANDTVYGLAAGVWSRDLERAKRVARRLRAGQVDINGARYNMLAPFGGFKQSGYGREYGHFGLEEFLAPKAVQI